MVVEKHDATLNNLTPCLNNSKAV